MRKFYSLLLSGLFTFLFSCQLPNEKSADFKLLPLPQEFEISGNSSLKYSDILNYYSPTNTGLPVQGNLLGNILATEKPSDAQIIFSIDSLLEIRAEGYTLNISKKQISIIGKDNAGLFYAFQTLQQLLEDAKEQDVPLPLCSIDDYPLLSYRAIHLDVKHHLEKTDYYYRLMDKLASYKVNAVIVEMEDKLKYERRPLIGSADALSKEEWINLSNYAKERNIEISPLIQGLGHASFILKHEKYKDLRDDLNSDWAFNPLDPKTYELQFDLYLDAIEATPHGKYLHVGGDEVHTTGRESGISPLALQLNWLDKVSKFAERQERIPIFWDDMPLKQAGVYKPMFNTSLSQEEVDKVWEENEHKLLEFLDDFPKNCVYMRWNYSSSEAIGNAKAMEWFRNHGMQVMGATAGQTRWKLMPQNESNMDNIKSFALSSIDNDLKGLFLTLWDDDSPHFELYMRGIIAFSEYSWTGEKRSKEEIKAAYRQREFSTSLSGPEYAFIDQLEEPVAFWNKALLKSKNRNQLNKLTNPIDEAIIDLPDTNKGEWSTIYAEKLNQAAITMENCNAIATKIAHMKSKAIRNNYTLEVYEQVNLLVQFSAKALLTLEAYDKAETKQQELDAIVKINELSNEFKSIRSELEQVYASTRILEKPENYILDQDHHRHLANQSISFDWQFISEILFLEKVEQEF